MNSYTITWAFVGALSCLLTCSAFGDWDQFRIVWQDEFETFDSSKWDHEVTAWGGGNKEFQLYSPDSANSFVRDGKLFIKPTLLADNINPKTGQRYGETFMQNGILDLTAYYGKCTMADNNGCNRTGENGDIPPVMSARLRTAGKFSFTWGRVVIRAKMPVGDWLWPAIWMLPEDWVYGGWPRSGEIDIVESVGNRDLKEANGNWLGIQRMQSSMHWGPAWDKNGYPKTTLPKYDTGRNYGDNFHTYIFDWSRNGLRFFIDSETQALLDVPYPLINQNPGWVDFWTWGGSSWNSQYTNPWAGHSNLAPFDQKFHFLLNVAVGGNAFHDGAINRGGNPAFKKPWSSSDSHVTSMLKFYNARGNWKWTWDGEGDNNAMQVDYIRVYQRINP